MARRSPRKSRGWRTLVAIMSMTSSRRTPASSRVRGVNGDVLGLRRQASIAVEDRRGEIPARVEDLRVGRAEHGLPHLLDDGLEAVLDDRDGDAIETHGGHYTTAAGGAACGRIRLGLV